MEFPYVVPVEDLKHIHLYIKSFFCARKNPNVQLVGRLKTFIENWKSLTNDTEILSLVEVYTVPFHEIPQQKNILDSPKLSQEEKIKVQKKIHEMLNKGTIVETPKHLEGNRPVINLKHLNQFIPYQYLKMEGLHCLRNVLKKGGYMCKLDLKDAYFSVTLNSVSRKFVRFLWSGKLCVSLPLPGPSTKNFYK